MSYFGRLSQRVGPAAPRAQASPVVEATFGATDVAGLESFAEVTVPGPSAAITQSASLPIADAAAGVNPAIAPESRSNPRGDFAEPGRHDIARAASQSAPRDWVAIETPLPQAPPDQPSASPQALQETVQEQVSTKIVQASRPRVAPSRDDRETDTQTRLPRLTPVAPSESTVEGPSPPLTASNVRAARDPAAETPPMRSGSKDALEINGDIVSPARRIVPRDRDEREPRRQDHTMPPAARGPAPQRTREASVEVRIGAVTLQVHAPPAPAAPQAPSRASFAPHRHYLRMW